MAKWKRWGLQNLHARVRFPLRSQILAIVRLFSVSREKNLIILVKSYPQPVSNYII